VCIPIGDACPVSDTSSITTLAGARALAAARARRKPATPIELAARLIKGYVRTPSLTLLSDALLAAITTDDARLIISCPPRLGKTLLTSVVTPIFCLLHDPDASILIASHGDQLAEESSRECRRLITEHSASLGISLAPDAGAVGRWKVANHRGGMWAGAVTGGPVGFGVSRRGLLIVDDPIRGAVEADSAAYRRRLYNEFKAALLSRLEPGASCVVVASRWAERDLTGELLVEPDSPWQLINIPAIATAGVPDALGREPGAPVINALGRDLEGFLEIKRAVGERAWAALYLGAPSAPTGALIKRNWLDDWRLPAAPQRPVRTVVGVDPSDSGSGDACGLVAASLGADGMVAVIADLSAPMTSDAWARAAVALAADVGASQIVVEAFAARETYTRVLREALNRATVDRPITITAWPPRGSGRGGGDAVARAAALLQALETGTCRLAGHFPDFEAAATSWQAGQHCPDALAALVVAHDTLVHAASRQWGFVAPVPGATLGRPTPARSGRVVVSIDEMLRQRRSLRAI
jgi:hypothetical protein